MDGSVVGRVMVSKDVPVLLLGSRGYVTSQKGLCRFGEVNNLEVGR